MRLHRQGLLCRAVKNMTLLCAPTCSRAAQLILSQIQDFDRLWWLSVLAAVMSFLYSFIGLGLSIAKTARARPVPWPK